MTMYNMLFGRNDSLLIIASVIMGFDMREKFPRFRNIFTSADDAPIYGDLYVFTRMGGGNANCWEKEEEDCTCPACRVDKLEEEPLYLC